MQVASRRLNIFLTFIYGIEFVTCCIRQNLNKLNMSFHAPINWSWNFERLLPPTYIWHSGLKSIKICINIKKCQLYNFLICLSLLSDEFNYENIWLPSLPEGWHAVSKSRIQESLNLSMCADSSNDKISGVRCQVSRIRCHVSHVTCHMLITPTATATDPPPANFSTMQSRMLLLIVS